MKNPGKNLFIDTFDSHDREEELNLLGSEAPCSVYGYSTSCMSQFHTCMKFYYFEHLH
jgi:hypothetical protein